AHDGRDRAGARDRALGGGLARRRDRRRRPSGKYRRAHSGLPARLPHRLATPTAAIAFAFAPPATAPSARTPAPREGIVTADSRVRNAVGVTKYTRFSVRTVAGSLPGPDLARTRLRSGTKMTVFTPPGCEKFGADRLGLEVNIFTGEWKRRSPPCPHRHLMTQRPLPRALVGTNGSSKSNMKSS